MIDLHAVFQSPGVHLPMNVLIDASGVEHITAEAFETYLRTVGPSVSLYRKHIRRQALVIPRGVAGSIFAGFYRLVGPLVPRHRIFQNVAEGLQWLDVSSQEFARVDDAVRQAYGESALQPLRTYLEQHLATTSAEDAAQALGLSVRTLHRRLSEAGTSFRVELDRVRLDLAKALLSHTGMSLEQVAARVGFATAAHLVFWFRKQVGNTPGSFRAREAGAPHPL